MIGYQEYPLAMTRGGEQAIARNLEEAGVLAEAGYIRNGGDRASYEAMTVGRKPSGYTYREYPKWVDGVLIPDPDAPPPPTNEYPKMREGVIVKSRDEETARFGVTAPAPEMTECLSAIAVAEAETEAGEARDSERQALVELAEEQGIHIDKRWGTAKLRQALNL